MVLFRNCILGVIILSISLSSLTYGKENHVIHIDEFIVNIISEEINHYAKVSLAIEMSNEPAMTAANRKIDKVRDTILLLVSNKMYDEIIDNHGKKQLKTEISKRLNSLLGEGAVTEIFFTDFVVQ